MAKRGVKKGTKRGHYKTEAENIIQFASEYSNKFNRKSYTKDIIETLLKQEVLLRKNVGKVKRISKAKINVIAAVQIREIVIQLSPKQEAAIILNTNIDTPFRRDLLANQVISTDEMLTNQDITINSNLWQRVESFLHRSREYDEGYSS